MNISITTKTFLVENYKSYLLLKCVERQNSYTIKH
jgi:hypothetical protein